MTSTRKILFSYGLRRLLCVAFLITVMGLTVPKASAVTSPVGNWSITANTSQDVLQINTLTSSGTIYGTLMDNPIIGTFDNSTGDISFLREIKTDFSYYQVYTGKLSGTFLSGQFIEFYGGLSSTSASTVYSWYAYLNKAMSSIPLPTPTEEYVGTANGYSFNLYDYADSQGTMTGTIFGNSILGYRSQGNNAFNFVRVISSDFSYFQIFIASTIVGCGGANQIARHFIGGQFAEVFIYGPTDGFSGPAYSWSASRLGDQCI